MSMHHASMYGGCLGLLAGLVVSLLFNLDLADSAYRTGILVLSGAWMGWLLAWLHSLLQPAGQRVESREGNHRS